MKLTNFIYEQIKIVLLYLNLDLNESLFEIRIICTDAVILK